MEIYTDISFLHKRLNTEKSIAFVPTMGCLHEGHLSLIKTAQQHARCTVVSIFVNKLQFLPHEDFNQYPRSLDNDYTFLEKQQVDILFAPNEKTIYPIKQAFTLNLPTIADTLEGKFRPGFFNGITTVVLKLFNIIRPQVAVFGKKDYQQLFILREMVKQLNLPIKMIACETVRSPNGLALSSRNQYLNKKQLDEAAHLYQTLNYVKQAIRKKIKIS